MKILFLLSSLLIATSSIAADGPPADHRKDKRPRHESQERRQKKDCKCENCKYNKEKGPRPVHGPKKN